MNQQLSARQVHTASVAAAAIFEGQSNRRAATPGTG